MKPFNKKWNITFSFVISIPLFLYAPFEMFLLNYEEFGFGINSIWIWILLGCLIVTCFLYLLGLLFFKISKKLVSVYYCFLFFLGILVFLQGNILCTNAGLMTGEPIDWGMHEGHFLKDGLIWILFIIIAILFGFFSKDKIINCLSIISTIFVITQLISLFILIISSPSKSKSTNQSFVSDKNLFNLSSDENVVVIIPDMFDARYLDSLLETNPKEINTILNGFTYYQNCTGSYSTTEYSIPSLLTGQYLMNNCGNTYEEMIANLYENNELFFNMKDDGYLFDVYTYKHMIPYPLLLDSTNYIANANVGVGIKDIPAFLLKLYKLVLCKYGPDFIKPYTWFYKNELASFGYSSDNDCSIYSVENLDFLDNILHSSINKSSEKRFKFIHIDGAHYPYITDENLKLTNMPQNEETACKTSLGVIKLIGMYLNKMKESNVFDNSAIIIIADHGYYGGGTLCSPVLLIKPLNSNNSFQISKAPVSSIDFCATIADIVNYEDITCNGDSVLKIDEGSRRERLFYQYYLLEGSKDGLRRLIEYSVLPNGRERVDFMLTDREISNNGSVVKHSVGCEFCTEHGLAPTDTSVTEDITHRKIA